MRDLLLLAFSLALNLLGLGLAAAFIRKKGGLQFVKSKLAARGVIRDRALERFESASMRTRVELFEMFPPGPDDIVMLGDSLTELAPWPRLLGLSNVHNHGISGDTAPGLLRRIEALGEPGTVVVLVGLNDLNNGQTPEGLVADVLKLLTAIATQAPHARVIVQSLLPVDTFIWGVNVGRKIVAYNALIAPVVQTRGLEWLDLHTLFCLDGRLDPACTHDGLHLNAVGYARWVGAIAPKLGATGFRAP